jgi:hypothetical protein
MNEQSWRKFVQSCHPGQYLIRVFSELAKVSAAFFLTEFQLWRNSNCFLRRETKTHLHILTRGANFVLMLVCSKWNVLCVITTTQPLVRDSLFYRDLLRHGGVVKGLSKKTHIQNQLQQKLSVRFLVFMSVTYIIHHIFRYIPTCVWLCRIKLFFKFFLIKKRENKIHLKYLNRRRKKRSFVRTKETAPSTSIQQERVNQQMLPSVHMRMHEHKTGKYL